MRTSARVVDRIARDFDQWQGACVLADLRSLDLGESSAEHAERICAAILVVADGDLARFGSAVALAERDWRDVLVSAGLANEDWRKRLDHALGPPPTATTLEDSRPRNAPP